MKNRAQTVTLILDFKGRELGRWHVDRPLTVGRTADNDIVVDNLSVSRRHAAIEPTDAGCVIRDAGSLNGIQVNGVVTGEAVLAHGDVVTLGKHRIICHVESDTVASGDPALFEPTMMAAPGEVPGSIEHPGHLTAVGGETHPLDRPLILIGTDEAADIVITGKSIAAYHAEIAWEDGTYTLRHLEGRCAVKVDGDAIESCVLEDECAIVIGDWTFTFHAPVPSTTAG